MKPSLSKFYFVWFYIFKTIEGRSFKLIPKASLYMFPECRDVLTHFARTFKSSVQWVPMVTCNTRMRHFVGLCRSSQQWFKN